jgi:hypothetical protein
VLGLESLQEASAAAATGISIAIATGKLTLKVTIRQAEADSSPRVEVDGFLGTLHILLSPQQLHMLQDIAESLAAQGNPWVGGANV